MATFNFGNGDDTENGLDNENDVMNGNGGNDKLSGLGGDDEIFGGIGNDFLVGGAGADFLNGEDGRDRLIGGGGNDVLFGLAGSDVLKGGRGIDFLNGNGGNAKLTGGSGKDNFQVDVGAGRVFILDFTDNVDTLLLDDSFYQGKTVQQILNQHGTSSGGDSAIDLSGKGDDALRIILIGVDNIFDMANDITLV